MKRKLPIILIILICFCSLTVLSSCDYVLDLIFGPVQPDNPDNNEPPAHTHSMTKQTYEGETCVGQGEITYYKCDGCGKYYLDEEGKTEIADISELGKGHLYVIKTAADEHYFECDLCHTEQENSREKHSSDRWWHNYDCHYKICDVCGAEFDVGAHDGTGSCTVCGRKTDYKALCNGSYGYDQLATLPNGANMQKLYNKIDNLVSSVHDDENTDATRRNVGQTADGQTVYAYALNDISVGGILSSDESLTASEAYVTVASYNHDHPLYYWLDKQCSVSVSSLTEKVSSVTLCVVEDYAKGENRVAQNNTVYNEIDGYLSAVSDETDAYYISLALHDAIIDDVEYAYKADGATPESAQWAHSIVGVFDSKSSVTSGKAAVCEGYAKAYQLLLNACGVNNVYVTGSSKDVGHAWNAAQLSDGEWYLYDLTWDDQPNLVNGKNYEYFCRTANVFNRDHKATEQNVNTGMNYLYALPEFAVSDYTASVWLVGKEVTLGDVTYTLAGYNRLAVNKVLRVGEDGVVSLPSAVEHNGKTFTVRQINDEAFATYTYGVGNIILSVAHPSVKTVVIPDTVDIVYNKSFIDCKSIVSVEFEDTANWQRYALTGQRNYEQISADGLSDGASAYKLLKEVYKRDPLSSSYVYVWLKTA